MAWAKEIYVATANGGVYYTNDFVDPSIQPTWTPINEGLPNPYRAGEFHLDPFNQAEIQYILTGRAYAPDGYNALYKRYMGSDWVEMLSANDFAHVCGWEDGIYKDSFMYGFCTDPTIKGRLWVVGKIQGPYTNYGAFGWGPYWEERAAYTNDYGETWACVPSWWTGWNPGTPTSIRSYGDTLYLRDGGGLGDAPYIHYSYDMGGHFQWVDTDLVEYTLGGFFNPLTPNRFYYDTLAAILRYFENSTKYQTINGIKIGSSQWDTMWYNEDNPQHLRLIYEDRLYTTYDGWQSTNSPSLIDNGLYSYKYPLSISPYGGDTSDYIILGMTYHGQDNPIIGTLYGEEDINLTNISGTNWNIAPYTDSIQKNNIPCRCGIQGVHKLKGYIYVNAVAMPNYIDITSGNMGKGVPMDGDRSAWNAKYYYRRHAGDINSASTISLHHTLAQHFVNKTTGSYKAAAGNHSHYFRDMSSGSSIAGEILTSLGTGSPTWHTLADHSHTGSAIGDGAKFNADHLSSGSQPINSAIIYQNENINWKAINVWSLSLFENTNANSSNKEFTVPNNTELQILWAWIEFSSTATPGSRQIEIQITDSSDNVINKWQAGATQDYNTTRKYLFALVVPDLTSFRDSDYLMTPIPSSTFLSAGQKIRIWDNKAIDASSDDMTVRLQYSYHTV